ncbi:DNA-binding XRE family transcriptional regulator [Sphingorhabdus rigui]|uniref:DNA-binding XRE family transcriptional regulator n=1 Tax=Sphingorhabdus rigui TaxID=1282858 RepID=A0A840B487_9SPHN|nr:DUF5681 domain-containing protein [Sphingorhabdus rigui]MBB3943986.1 DNA-binding XRE family transcriptional regulator [Sphingorhabdus rigui]
MSKSSRQKSINPNYEVGYGRPPVATQFPPKTSGNPRGRPPKAKAKGQPKPDTTSGLSAVQRAVLHVGDALVEVRRGGRTVKMTQHEAVVEGLAVAARQGHVRAAQIFIQMYSEAEAEDRRQSINVNESWELALQIAASLRAAKRDGPDRKELTPPMANIEGAAAEWADAMRPSEAPQTPSIQPNGHRNTPPDSECVGAALLKPLPTPPSDAPAYAEASSLPTPAARVQPIVREAPATKAVARRYGDPLIPDRRPIKAGGWALSG